MDKKNFIAKRVAQELKDGDVVEILQFMGGGSC